MATGTGETDKYAVARLERQKHVDTIVAAEARKRLVVAGPGTGKTYLFKALLRGKEGALTLTFVNSLVDDLSLELYGLADVMTLHGYALRLLNDAFRKRFRVHPWVRMVVEEDAQILLGENVDFEGLINTRADNDPRLGFYSNRRKYYDHFGYTDVVYAAVLYLERNPGSIPRYPLVLVDEFQDFSELEVSFIELLAKRSPVLFAGDDDQALYAFRAASPTHIRNRHCGTVPGYKCFELPYCSRSTRVIVEAADDVLKRAVADGHLKGRIKKAFQYFPDPDKDKVSAAFPRLYHYPARPGMVSWIIEKRVKELARQLRDEFTVLVLAPFHLQCGAISSGLKSKGFTNVKYVPKSETTEPTLLDGVKLVLDEVESNLGWRICAKQLLGEKEFRDLLVKTYPETTTGLHGLVANAVKEPVEQLIAVLRKVVDEEAVERDKLDETLGRLGRDPHGAALAGLRADLLSGSQRLVDRGVRRLPITVTTLQSAKGLDADFVFITYFDDACFVKNKDKSCISDLDICSFLVALTRARAGVHLVSTKGKTKPTFLTWIHPARVEEIPCPER